MIAKARKLIEAAIHKVDEKCGRDAAIAARDLALFEFDRLIELEVSNLFPGESSDE